MSENCQSVKLFYLPPDIITDDCDFNFFYNMAPKAAILDAGDTLLFSNLDKPCYLHFNKHNSIPVPIAACDYTVINRSLLCDCQL